MVRYARAKGSKSSNEKLPNEATPWHVMKEQIETKNFNKQDKQIRKTAKQLLQEKEEPYYATKLNVKTDWANFEDTSSKKDISNKKEKKPHQVKLFEEKNTLKEEPVPETKNIKNKSHEVAKKRKIQKKEKIEENSELKNIKKESNEVTKKPKIQKKEKVEENSKPDFVKKESVNVKPKEEKQKDEIVTVKNENSEQAKTQVLSAQNKKKLKKQKRAEKRKLKEITKETTTTEGEQKFLTKRQKRNKKKQKLSNEENSTNPNKQNFDVNKHNANHAEGREFNKNLPPKKIRRHTHLTPAKIRDDKFHQRRKPEEANFVQQMNINGVDVEIVKYDGFPVRKEDADRLKELRKQMVIKGIPKSDIDTAMKFERRRAEKSLTRMRKHVCFLCRKTGHNLSDCPNLDKEQSATGICFKCGSTEHTHFECKVNKTDDYRFASCFICRQRGHIAKQCPDNPKGLYPDGGSCNVCGDVTHLKLNCPDLLKQKEEATLTVNTISNDALESLDEDITKKTATKDTSKQKAVVF